MSGREGRARVPRTRVLRTRVLRGVAVRIEWLARARKAMRTCGCVVLDVTIEID